MLMHTLENLPAVIIAGLAFGAGLPAIFAIAMWAQSGQTKTLADGTIVETKKAPLPMRILAYILYFVILASVVIGVLWISQHFLYVTFGLDIFGTGGQG
ncbi:MAG: hypothetical protein WAN89_06340 [Lawsonella sp.]|nr:hypothetical protein [Mycobacteriales bacterium]